MLRVFTMLSCYLHFSLAQVRQPDRFVISGLNLAFSQAFFDTFPHVLEDAFDHLNHLDLNLAFPQLLHLKLEDDDSNPTSADYTNSTKLIQWDLERINIRNISFDKGSTNTVLIEPS